MKNQHVVHALLATFAMGWTLQAGEVFRAGFEESDTPSYTAAQQLHVAGGEPFRWNWGGDDIGVISDEPVSVFGGSQGMAATRSSTPNSQYWWTRGTNAFAAITSGVVSVRFAVKTEGWSNSGNSFLECWVQMAALDASDDGANKDGRSAYVALRGDGRFQAYTNNSGAITLVNGLDVAEWHEVRVEIDLSASVYNVFLNDAHVATNFTFFGASALTAVRSIQFKEYNNGSTTGGVYIDDVLVSVTDAEVVEIVGVQPVGNLAVISVGATSTSRLYKVQSLGDLMPEPQTWIDTGAALPGNGDALPLTITNSLGYSYYRIQSGPLE